MVRVDERRHRGRLWRVERTRFGGPSRVVRRRFRVRLEARSILRRADLPRIVAWISARFHARLYEDAYSPFCLIAGNNGDADIIHEYLAEYCRSIPHLALVRNDVYARFSHEAFNKGTALAELTRRLGLSRDAVFAAGDQLNDLPMLSRQYARWLAAPSNALEVVKLTVRRQEGFVSELPHGIGVAEGLEFCLANAQRAQQGPSGAAAPD